MIKRIVVGITLAMILAAAVLYAFFATPEIPRDEIIAKYRVPTSQFFTLPTGGEGHYRIDGNPDGYKLVLVHGSNASTHTWQQWIELLSDDFYIVSLDLPGHGLTGALPGYRYDINDMVTFVDAATTHLGWQQFALAGSSMGGNTAWQYAVAHPDKVTHAILVAPSGVKYPEGYRAPFAFRIMKQPFLATLMLPLSVESAYQDGLKRSFYDHSKITREMLYRYKDLNRMEGTRAATVERGRTMYDRSNHYLVEDLQSPTLIMWGEQDTVLPLSMGYEFAERIPNNEFVVFPKVGHLPQEEVPELSAKALRDFVLGDKSR